MLGATLVHIFRQSASMRLQPSVSLLPYIVAVEVLVDLVHFAASRLAALGLDLGFALET